MTPDKPTSTMQNSCIICHKKKVIPPTCYRRFLTGQVKCDLHKKKPCSNCAKAGSECL